ncbi:LapA family protein [Bartonella sp. TP]|uniref:LapA family protein n=1 Tax=Bartonella sp. TP TaxID=3057550 RepID=UPI0025B02AC9|nr:LapA family protein [Bartonella sp. TP]MDN5249042.1 LapA family protein [Alphaproteobacteria bacterium]WJW80524.1 LapA family protein [Bartonella sp. TP]
MKLKNIIYTLFLLPISIFLIGFISSNNQIITIHFNPFVQTSATLSLPLCLALIGSLALGFVLSGLIWWIKLYGYKREFRKLHNSRKNLQLLDVTKD